MASFKEHCDDCERELGEPFPEVHKWLDEFFAKLKAKHRDVRHHQGGVEEARKKWGDRAARAAEIHIAKDTGGIIPTEKQAQMWSLFGPPGIGSGSSFLTDQVFEKEHDALRESILKKDDLK